MRGTSKILIGNGEFNMFLVVDSKQWIIMVQETYFDFVIKKYCLVLFMGLIIFITTTVLVLKYDRHGLQAFQLGHMVPIRF